jgi:hypothetical protein
MWAALHLLPWRWLLLLLQRHLLLLVAIYLHLLCGCMYTAACIVCVCAVASKPAWQMAVLVLLWLVPPCPACAFAVFPLSACSSLSSVVPPLFEPHIFGSWQPWLHAAGGSCSVFPIAILFLIGVFTLLAPVVALFPRPN